MNKLFCYEVTERLKARFDTPHQNFGVCRQLSQINWTFKIDCTHFLIDFNYIKIYIDKIKFIC